MHVQGQMRHAAALGNGDYVLEC